jgi:putative aldouronate transport system substrate-binding protein
MRLKKLMSKMVAGAITLSMILMLAACDNSGKTSEDAKTTTESNTTAKQTANPTDEATDKVQAEAGEITIWYMNEGENYQKVFDRFEELTKDTLNTSINLNWTTDHKQEMPLKLMNQEPCDLTFDGYFMNMAKNIQDGLYADLASYFNNPEYPGLQKAFTGDLLTSMYDSEGHIYGVPMLETYNDSRCIFLRGDWRKKYNIPEVTDDVSFYNYLTTIMEHKDELGIESAVGVGNRGYFYLMEDFYTKIENNICEVDSTGARATQQFNALISEDGKKVLDLNVLGDPDDRFSIYPEGYQINYRNQRALDLGSKWGQFINEDFATGSDISTRFNNGKFAAGEGNLAGYVSSLLSVKASNPDAELECYFYEPQVRNMEKTFSNQSYSNNYAVVPYYSENIDRTMKFLDWIFTSQENNDLFHYGIEGEDYTLNSDGTMTSLSPANKYRFPGYELCWSPLYYHTDSTLGDYVVYDQWARNKDNFSPNPILGFVFNTNATTELSTSLAAYKALQENYYHQFMAGAFGADTSAKLEEFYQQAKPDIEVIRTELMTQMQNYLDTKK